MRPRELKRALRCVVAPLVAALSLLAPGCTDAPELAFDPNDAYYRYGPLLAVTQPAHRIALDPIETAAREATVKRDILVERVFLVCWPTGEWPATAALPRVSLHRPGAAEDARDALVPADDRGDRVSFQAEGGPTPTDYAVVELAGADLGSCEALVFGARGRLTPLPAPPPKPADDETPKDDEKPADEAKPADDAKPPEDEAKPDKAA